MLFSFTKHHTCMIGQKVDTWLRNWIFIS